MNSRINILIIIIFLALAFMTGCQKNAPVVNNTENLVRDVARQEMVFTYITNPERVEHRTFSIVMPADWKEVEYNGVLVYMPQDGELADPLSEKISMVVGFLAENETRTLKQITESEINKSMTVFPSLQIMSWDDNSRIGQLDATKLLLSMRIQDKTLITTQLRVLHGSTVYAFSIQCEQDKCKYLDIFNEMASSFEWKNP